MLSERLPSRSEPPSPSSPRRKRPRPYEFLPEALLVVGLTVFLIDEPDAATSAFESGRAIALMTVVGIVWVGARLVLARAVRWPVLRLVTFGLASLAALAVVVAPAYDDDTVIETFPGTDPAQPVPAPTDGEAAGGRGGNDANDATAPAANAPVRVRVGSFRGVDHRASGTVAIYRQPDGRHVVGLEDFDLQPGPDYDLYIVPGAEREDRDGGTRLDDLRGNRGTQFYDVPPDVDPVDGAWTVLVWCQTFGVPIATATPA